MPDSFFLFGTEIALNTQLFVFFAVIFVAGIIRGFTGFGSALLVVPALAALYGPVQAVVIEVLVEIPITLALLPTVVKSAERRTILPMLCMFMVFVPIGALFLRWIDPEPLKIIISLVVLAMVGVMAFQSRILRFVAPSGIFATGAVAGFTQGLTAVAGPLFVSALLARGDDPKVTRANIVALAGGLITMSVLSYALVGLIDSTTIIRALLATPAILLGVWVGSVLFARFGGMNLRVVILVFLAITAVVTLLGAV